MALFRRGSRNRTFDTGHPGDDELLRQLAARNPLTTPRHWLHYVYCPDEVGARAVEAEIAGAGWGIRRVGESAQDAGWVVIAERHDAVTSPDAVREARLFFEGVAARVPGSDYDGWEASV